MAKQEFQVWLETSGDARLTFLIVTTALIVTRE
jgi:hypothetical protein